MSGLAGWPGRRTRAQLDADGVESRLIELPLEPFEEIAFLPPDVRRQQPPERREAEVEIVLRVTPERAQPRAHFVVLAHQRLDQLGGSVHLTLGERKQHRFFEAEMGLEHLIEERDHPRHLVLAARGPVGAGGRGPATNQSLGDHEYVVMLVRERDQARMPAHLPTIQYGVCRPCPSAPAGGFAAKGELDA